MNPIDWLADPAVSTVLKNLAALVFIVSVVLYALFPSYRKMVHQTIKELFLGA